MPGRFISNNLTPLSTDPLAYFYKVLIISCLYAADSILVVSLQISYCMLKHLIVALGKNSQFLDLSLIEYLCDDGIHPHFQGIIYLIFDLFHLLSVSFFLMRIIEKPIYCESGKIMLLCFIQLCDGCR